MKDLAVAMLIALPFLFFIVWMWGWSVGYRDAKIEDRAAKADGTGNKNSPSKLGRIVTLSQLSARKKGGIM